MDGFVGRNYEYAQLEVKFKGRKSSLGVIYGRRRVGKSRLLREFCKDRHCLRFEGLEKADTAKQIRHFLKQVAEQTHKPMVAKMACQGWAEALDILNHTLGRLRQKMILVFDEFPWMIEERDEYLSIFKYYWDNTWSASDNRMVIFCGSVNTFMVKKLLQSSAFYGRVDLEIHLDPLPLHEAKQFFRQPRSEREILDAYMVFGGIPKYLEEMDSRESTVQNIQRLCFDKDAFFVHEFQRLFKDEFGSSEVYAKIVRLLAKYRSLNLSEISGLLKREAGGGYKIYLENLALGGFVQAFTPMDKQDTQLQRYRLVDEYVLFYFHFIHPNLPWIQKNTKRQLFLNYVGKQRWNIWAGFAFERFCIKEAQTIQRLLKIDQLTKNYGSFFNRATRADQGFQIDLLFERHDNVFTVCEMKYGTKPVGTDIIPEIEQKIKMLTLQKRHSVEKVLISATPPTQTLQDMHYFNRVIGIEEFFAANL